ncbi:MAG: glycosyltransferase family 2 protein [Pseudomonadota bacterium]
MATVPYFVISPNTVLSVAGLLHGPDKTVPTPAEDWRQAVVDVVIPAYNEQANIVLTLECLLRQTLKPRRIVLVDDGSQDHTMEYAQSFAAENGLQLDLIRRDRSIGKTPTIKRQARESDADVELVLDADTVLASDNYIERLVQELYQGVGIASACGVVMPMREKDRRERIQGERIAAFLSAHPDASLYQPGGTWWHRFNRNVTNLYRGELYAFLQRFIYKGQMSNFGSITNPVGCAVAYRRKYIKDLFDTYEPILGDDLTNSEDIFIGFALLNQGYRNIQLQDVTALSLEPEARNLPKQIYLWSSSFLQSCYYFDDLMRSPFKTLRRWRHRRAEQNNPDIQEKRKIKEAYRQPFGEAFTREYGRPMGWVLFMSAAEKVFFPTAIIIMALLQWWEALVITLIAETVLSVGLMAALTKTERFRTIFKGLLMTPVRYLSLLYDMVTISRFAADLWLTGNRNWRK